MFSSVGHVNITFYLQVFVLISFLLRFAQLSHLALLSGTLKKFSTHACDGDGLNIKCPNGTLISIVGATYQKSTHPDYLCLPTTEEQMRHMNTDQDDCFSSAAFVTVVNACQEKQACKMVTSPRTLGGDPCPGVRKLASIEHRCRPQYFKRKVICEGQTISLRCPRGKRIAIYSAEFGRSQKDKVLECPLPDDMKEKTIKDCQASYATETVLKMCHGQRRCSIPATTGTFGNPCQQNVNSYLRVEFTCVPKEILKDDFKDTSDINSRSGGDIIFPNYGLPGNDKSLTTRSPHLRPRPSDTGEQDASTMLPSMNPTNDSNMQSDEMGEESGTTNSSNGSGEVIISSGETRIVGFVTEWISAYSFIKENKEKFILYLTLSLSSGVLLLLIVLSTRLYCQKKKKKKKKKMNISDPMPSVFADNTSELEHFGSECAEQPDTVEVVRYANRNSMKRQDGNSHPRAPMSMSLNNYYYS